MNIDQFGVSRIGENWFRCSKLIPNGFQSAVIHSNPLTWFLTNLIKFACELEDEFELARSHILHQNPLPTVSQAIHKLVDDETCLIFTQTMVLAIPAVIPQSATPIFPSVGSSTYVSKGKENNVRGHNNKKPLLIYSLC